MSNDYGDNTPPDWDKPEWYGPKSKTHEWKRYMSTEVARLWPSFTAEQKQAIARQAQDLADKENWE